MRQQLTLYVPRGIAEELDRVRAAADPIQHRLIAAHVTLCRDDELSDFASILSRLDAIPLPPPTLVFGRPEPFSDHGVLLPCIDGEEDFHALRRHLLGTSAIRMQKPHITIAHPRNFPSLHHDAIDPMAFPERLVISFPEIHWIEQQNGEPWRTLKSATLPLQ